MTRMLYNRRALRLAPWLFRLTVVASVPVLSACGHPSATVQTDPTVIAQRAIQTLKVLDVVVDAVTAARDAGWITPQVARSIELAIQKAVPVITSTPDGARGVAVAALQSAKSLIGSEKVQLYLTWGQTAIQALP